MTVPSFCTGVLAAFITLALSAGAAAQPLKPTTFPPAPVNLDFEDPPNPPNPIKGWKATTPATRPALSPESPAKGAICATLSRTGQNAASFGTLMQSFSAHDYRGKRVELTAMLRYTGSAPGQAQLWLRSDRTGSIMGFFDNMEDRPVRAKTWTKGTIIADIEPDADLINIGLILMGQGPAAIDDVTFRVLPDSPAADQPPRPLEPRALDNLTAFARLFGYIRHFHPSDEALATNWTELAIAGVEAVESAADPGSLAQSLSALFTPIAPSVSIWAGGADSAPPPTVPEGATQFFSLKHNGYGGDTPGNSGGSAYRTELIKEPLDTPEQSRRGLAPGTRIIADLGGGVHAAVPIGVYAGPDATLPRASGSPARPKRPDGWQPSGNDRATRLADVVLAWNIPKHFYPYFDVAKTDWDAALTQALRTAATDPDAAAFTDTLGRLVAHLRDGHGAAVAPRHAPQYRLPLDWEFVGEALVVTATAPEAAQAGLKQGDAVLAIGGVPLADLYARTAETISAATPQWLQWSVQRQLILRHAPDQTDLQVLRPDGTKTGIALVPQPVNVPAPREQRPNSGDEIAPGIVYFNLDGVETGLLNRHMNALAAAKGIVFDMRGYPGSAGTEVISHITDQPVSSAKWDVPIYKLPDQKDVIFSESTWTLNPKKPRFTSNVAFLADGRAISYAESCLGIVEAYRLGEIVGSTTAGTNGNINPFGLPGGYRIGWTGMKVLKHDASRHHGVGISPTVPAQRTIAGIAAGRDEVLERAVEVLTRKIPPGNPTPAPPAPTK